MHDARDGSTSMGTKEFVKATGRDKIAKALQEEVMKLVDKKTGKAFEHMVDKRVCPLCRNNEEKNEQEFFYKNGFRFVKCRLCGMAYVNPVLKEESYRKYLEQSKLTDMWIELVTNSPAQIAADEAKFKKELEKINRHSKKGKILDIGCSTGVFLKLAKEDGWETVGLELGEKRVKIAKEKYGLDVRQQLLSEANFPKESFDAVALLEVLEHVSDPEQLLKEINAVLKKEGILSIIVPNFNSIAMRIMHEKSSAFGGHTHLNYFTIETLKKILEKTGYEAIENSTHVSELGTILNYLNYEDPYLGDAKLPQNLIEKISQIICDSGYGYKLSVIARKR